jgi:enamine deaminase RidA (YjgF/YER057c/UK114 family)
MHGRIATVDGLYGGVPYAYAATASAGDTVFTAGACPLDEAGRVVAPGDIEGQARHAIGNLLAVLHTAGCGPNDVVKTTVFVASAERADLVTAWHEVEQVFGSAGPPGTLVGVTALGWPDQLFEIEAVAVRPDGART